MPRQCGQYMYRPAASAASWPGDHVGRRDSDGTGPWWNTQVEYVIDARIFWNSMGAGSMGYISYDHMGWGAEKGEHADYDDHTVGS
jgi:hypothetical protein